MDLSRVVWRKSSRSTQNGSCVEVATAAASTDHPTGMIAVRDSKDPQGSILAFTPPEWQAFAAQVKGGKFDLT